MKKIYRVLVSILLFLAPMILVGQTNFSTNIIVADGADNADTITIGVNTVATYGLDGAFGEYELPPNPPTGVFDARSINIPGRPTTPPEGLGQGVSIDIRSLSEDIQTDTFRIKFQSSTEGGPNVTFSWDANIGDLGGGNWKIVNSLSGSPDVNIDMTKQSSLVVDAEEYSTLYIIKSDVQAYRTFTMTDIALNVDDKGKYRKIMKPKSNQVEFCLYLVNTEASPVNTLYMEFKTAVDSATLNISPFTIIETNARQKVNAKTKFTFSGATINPGDTVTICGFGVKSGTKIQAVGKYYWLNDGVVQGKKLSGKVGITFTENEIRLPMPNITTALDQMMKQAFPGKKEYLIMGLTDTIEGVKKDTFRYVEHKTYADIFKTLIKDYGKKGYLLQDSLADCIKFYDDKKKGFRYYKKPIYKKVKTLGPDKHRNRLLGEALVLKVNLLFSQTQKTPAGLGDLQITDPTSVFYGETLDTLSAQADQYLTHCRVGVNPSIIADELADMIAGVNSAFATELDTLNWSGSKIYYSGGKSIGDVGFLKRIAGMTPHIISDLKGNYENDESIVSGYRLLQNYPNPFNPTTTIEFSLPEEGLVTITVYNMLGQQVRTLADNVPFEPGIRNVSFDAQGISSGVYIYRIAVRNPESGTVRFQQTQKFILMK